MPDGRPVDVYVAVGSNVEPRRNIPAAMDELARLERITGASTFYVTTPIGPPGQAAFVNGVWRLISRRRPDELRNHVLRGVETRLGRRRSADRYAPRPIDLDLILWDDAAIESDELKLPSDDLARPFVAWPLLELAGEIELPGGLGSLSAWCRKTGPLAAERDAALTCCLKERLE